MAGSIGLRVVRGPDWKWANQDGGEGTVGTIVATQLSKVTNVRWDTGIMANYRAGAESAYDLRILDNAQCGVRHAGISCSHCNEADIPGMRWQCEACANINLCSACYMADVHDVSHTFRRFTTAKSSAVSVPSRSTSVKQTASGIFPGATVARGTDWKWGSQDGGKGKEGTVLEQISWSRTTCRDGVRVQWQSGSSYLYRLGHEGKVDLLQKVTGTGCKYYPEHLPAFGKAEQTTSGKATGTLSSPVVSASTSAPVTLVDGPILPGDEVLIELDPTLLEDIQRGHGGWTKAMNDLIGTVGRVQQVASNGDIIVEYEPKRRFTFHPAALRKVS